MRSFLFLVAFTAFLSGCSSGIKVMPSPNVPPNTPVSPITPTPVPPAAVGLVSFIIDDGRASDATWAKPLFDKTNTTAAVAVISGRVGLTGYLNAQQLSGFQADGWEIMSHSVTHPRLTQGNLTPEQVRQEITQSRADLEALGLRVQNWVTPYGALEESAEVMQIVRATYSGSFVATGRINDLTTTDPYHVHRISIDGQPLEVLRARVDTAAQSGGWVVFVMHSAYAEYQTEVGWESRRQAVADLLTYVAAERAAGRLRTVLPREGLALLSP